MFGKLIARGMRRLAERLDPTVAELADGETLVASGPAQLIVTADRQPYVRFVGDGRVVALGTRADLDRTAVEIALASLGRSAPSGAQ